MKFVYIWKLRDCILDVFSTYEKWLAHCERYYPETEIVELAGNYNEGEEYFWMSVELVIDTLTYPDYHLECFVVDDYDEEI